ncbi:MAG: molybdopterin-dependent oxidoreductase [Spirochaetes bacterium]|nr:molybdopterin-dependent oxidoreductase [Spirochaetota bacterium]
MKKIERKDFLKIGGGVIAGGLTGYVFSGAPFLGLQWLVEWTQDQHRPAGGPEEYLKTVCEACRQKCEMSIRMIGDRAVKIETSNSGCPFSQNGLQLLYHPERIDAPLKRTGKKGTVKASAFEKVTWEEALGDIAARMQKLISEKKGARIAAVSKQDNLAAALLERMIGASGSKNAFYEPSLDAVTRGALGGYLEYDFNNCDYILSFGARILEGWGTPCSINKSFVEWKKKGVKLVQADAICTRTASMADRWLPIKPGTELYLALGIANYLKRRGRGAGGAEWSAMVNDYTVEKTASLTGLSAKQIEEVAEAFARARNPVAVAGRGGKGVSSSGAEIMAVYALNVMAGSRAVTLKKSQGLGAPALSADAAESMKNAKTFAGLDDFIKNGEFDMLFVNEADPVYKSVYGSLLEEKMQKAFVVAVTPLLNDTALNADYVFPSLSFLEADNSAGSAPLKPYMKSVHAGDCFINLAKRVDAIKGNFPWQGYVDLLKTRGAALPGGNVTYNAGALREALDRLGKGVKAAGEYPLSMLPIELPYVGDGDGLAYPYVLKIIDPKTFSSDGRLWVRMNRATASKLGVSEGEKICIESSRGEIGSVRVNLTDTVAPDVIAVPLGFGHRAYTRYACGKGVNPKTIMANDIDSLTGAADWWLTRVKLS